MFGTREEAIKFSDAMCLEDDLSHLMQENKIEEALSIYHFAKKEFQRVLDAKDYVVSIASLYIVYLIAVCLFISLLHYHPGERLCSTAEAVHYVRRC